MQEKGRTVSKQSVVRKKREEISTIFGETTRMYKSGQLNLQPSCNPQRILYVHVPCISTLNS